MAKIGPFFYLQNRLTCSTCTLEKGRHQFDKIDNSYGHDELWDANFRAGDYIDFPRGRVVWDVTNDRAIVYIDPCINRKEVLEKIAEAFELDCYVVDSDDHYHCKKCIGKLFD